MSGKSGTYLAIILMAAAVAFAQAPAAVPASASVPSLDEILAKNLKAHGGAQKIDSIKTLRITGKLEFAPGSDLDLVIDQKRPNDIHMDYTIQGMTQSQGYDGKSGWGNDPFEGKRDAEPLGEDDLKDVQESVDFGFPLMTYKDKGDKVEYVGMEPVEGTDAYKIKVTLPNGDTLFYFLDTDYFLEIREQTTRRVRGSEREIDTTIGNYKEVDGLMMPFYQESGTKGAPNTQKTTYEKIEINPPLNDALFTMPQTKTSAAPAPKKAEK